MTLAPLGIGDVLSGFCGGWFGRDSYDDKRVEAIGSDWVVVRDERGVPLFAGAMHPSDLTTYRSQLESPTNRSPECPRP